MLIWWMEVLKIIIWPLLTSASIYQKACKSHVRWLQNTNRKSYLVHRLVPSACNAGSVSLLLILPSVLELTADGTLTPRLDTRCFQAAAEDISIHVDVGGFWIWSPCAPTWHFCVNCMCWSDCLLTYLHAPLTVRCAQNHDSDPNWLISCISCLFNLCVPWL